MNLQLIETKIPGCFELQTLNISDNRGCFVKTFHAAQFESLGLRTDWAEQYYSLSQPGVLRGLHFHLPPNDHAKLVYCVAGRVLDVAVDLRKGSPTFGEHISLELSARRANMLYLPAGLAHGFSTYDEQATMVYNVTSVYYPESDAGIHWSSISEKWPISEPLVSERDRQFPSLREFQSPFFYESHR
jgi:dTDP-4-dehydrorhamnose 3,5-epimerase